MGKTRKTKRSCKKVNPVGIPSEREMVQNELLELERHPEGPIQAIIEQLQSPNTEEKMNALQSLAIVSTNREKVALICSSELIRVAAPFLMDANGSIRNSTAGALRNLSVNGVEVCEQLVEQDVLTPLLALLSEYSGSVEWTPKFDSEMYDQLDERSDTFLQAISLLWHLCESTSSALESFNQTSMLQSFIRCLDYSVFGLDISIAVAQCLLVISEDNALSWTILNNYVPELLCLLRITGKYPHTFLRTLAAGILSNVPALAAAHLKVILEGLSTTLEINHRHVLGQVSSDLPLRGEEEENNEVADYPIGSGDETEYAAHLRRRRQDQPSETETAIKHAGWLLEAQRVSAEVISNICSSEDDDWVDNENEDSELESVHDYDVSHHDHDSVGNFQNGDKLPVEILEAVKCLGIVEKLWQRTEPIAENVKLILQENNSSLLTKLKNLSISSMLCLQNLCNCISTEDLGGPDPIYNVWLNLGQQVFQGPQDPSILEPATSLMRAALEHLKKSPVLFKQMTRNDLELMLNGVESCLESEIRANWLRMLGILGCLLPEPLVKLIISFILDACSKEQEVWTLSEAIDALMDMFSENDWNQIAYELNLHRKAKDLEKVFKSKLRQQKRELKDRYPAVMTVKTNLSRFTKYIEAQLDKDNFTPSNA